MEKVVEMLKAIQDEQREFRIEMNGRFETVDERFDTMDDRFNTMGEHLETIEKYAIHNGE